MKRKRTTLLQSVLALLLCIAMLTGTTFAWFTDEVESGRNVITAGNLDVHMYWAEDPTATVWHNAEDTSLVPFDYAQWEPGYTQVRYVKLVNAGSLALKYSLTLSAVSSVGKLAEVIGVYYAKDVTAKIPDRKLTGMSYLGLLKDAVNGGEAAYGDLQPGDETIVAIAMQMDTQAGNNYQGQDAGSFLFRLVASQMTDESDSFGSDYDADAGLMGSVIHYNISKNISTLTNQGTLTEAVTVGTAENEIFAEVPDGVKLENSADALSLSVNTVTASQADVKLENGENATSLDIHMAGVAEDNTIPMLITLKGLMKKGLNATSVAMYHVENGATVPMVLVANPQNHNEFSYDPATGDVTVAMASFSEVVAVVDNKNLWKGSFDTSWYNTADTEFTLTTADQLAGFGKIVDGTAEGIAADTFAGKTVKLGADIDLSGGYSLNPIGCGYHPDTKVNNSNGIIGTAFMGTFDGQNYTISGLYQNGWELGLSYCNLGGGLFASIANGAVKNLTITGANIVMECVEMGVLVGLSQGECTYENINIYHSKIANYQRATGGLIGEVSALNGGGATTITNVTIGSDVVVGSLWGDFDAPVGGVIGARWDDSDITKINMSDVTVAARLDVYNDVTSTYQWYAYRRAGMLIGNTEQVADGNAHLAAARFLTCDNVKVYYAPWVNYHYCEFNNHNSSWPWVRVEAGENCSAYSNPRYGIPNDPDTQQPVTSLDHNHSGDDEHNVELKFNQLYGGGQGVYGQPEHQGVDVINYLYTVTYVNDGKILDVQYVKEADLQADGTFIVENQTAEDLAMEWVAGQVDGTLKFGGWMNAGSTNIDRVPANNKKDIILYPHFEKPYTAMFVDQQGNILEWCFFNNNDADVDKLIAAKTAATNKLPSPGIDFELQWQVDGKSFNASEIKGYEKDVTVYPVYIYTGNLKLTPVDEGNDGTIEYYKVEAVADLKDPTRIPGNVNGIPVRDVERLYQNKEGFLGGYFDYGANVKTIYVEEGVKNLLHNSLAYTSDLDAVYLPNTLETMAKNTFSRNFGSDDNKKLTITYNGNKNSWDKVVANSDSAWAGGLAEGSTVVCTDGTYTLTETKENWYNPSNLQWIWSSKN